MTHPSRIAKGMYWDRAWSLVAGCSYVSEGCANCWSAAESHMRAGQQNPKIRERYQGLTDEKGRWNGMVRLLEKNLDLPLKVKKPTVWAVWNDLFHGVVPDWFFYKAYETMEKCKQHIFLILTKRIDKALIVLNSYEGRSWPLPNVWLGVTAENQEQANKRIPILLQIPAAVWFVSIEPMLGPVDFSKWFPNPFSYMVNNSAITFTGNEKQGYRLGSKPLLDWIIVGSESGPKRRTAEEEWLRSVKDQCVAAGVPFFLKQMEIDGKLVKMPELDGRTWDEMPERLVVNS